MNCYDPDHAPDPAQWLALDEQVRVGLVEEHHRRARVELPRLTAHAVLHTIVENQLAEDYAPVVRAMTRLTSAGLSRHDAVHAIAFVLAGHLNDLFGARADATDSLAIYAAAVERLPAASWRGSQG